MKLRFDVVGWTGCFAVLVVTVVAVVVAGGIGCGSDNRLTPKLICEPFSKQRTSDISG